jgi:hypothetical protein
VLVVKGKRGGLPTPSSFGEEVYVDGKVEKLRRPSAEGDVKLSHLCRFVNDERDE